MVGCEALGCKNRSEKGAKFYSFPVDPVRKKKWMIKARRMDLKNITNTNRKLCEAHFEEDQFTTTKKGKRRLRKDAVPTVFTHRGPVKKRKPPAVRSPGKPVPGEHNYTAEIKLERKDGGEEKTPSKQSVKRKVPSKDSAATKTPSKDGAETGTSPKKVASIHPSINLHPLILCRVAGATAPPESPRLPVLKKVAETGIFIPTQDSAETGISTQDGAETGIPQKEGAETGISIPTKDTAETGIPTKEGAETGIPTKKGAETGIPTKEGAETGIPAKEGAETGIPTKEGEETAIPAKEGAETGIPAKEGTETGISIEDVAETGIPSEDQQMAEKGKPMKKVKKEKGAQPAGIPKNRKKMELILEQQQRDIQKAQREGIKQHQALQKAQRAAQKARASLKRVRKEKARLQKRNECMASKLTEVFTDDQIRALGRGNTQGMLWSTTTIERALQILFAAGPTGYKALQDLHIPLPAVRTLQRRMQGVKFEPGVLEEVFSILKIKAAGMSELERECVLMLDEMAITQSVELHKASGRQYGEVTVPGHTGPATRACVFMLAGTTTTQWQQIVAYHYSGDATQGEVYKPIILEIIERAQAIGLHVIDVTTDMATPNQAMWSAFGVDHNTTSIPHPVTPDRQLYFMPDVPHLVKNLRNALVHGNVITIPDDVVEKEHLPSNTVSLEPIKDLVNVQEGMTLKIAPRLSKKSMETTQKVGPAKDIFSASTSAGLKQMVEKEGRPESNLATAWFLEQVGRWFELMSFRHPVTALSSLKTPEYENAKVFLNSIVELFCNITIGTTGEWSTIQTGVVMATRSMLAIQEEMLGKGHTFVLTARFTLDCLEGVFSCVRYRDPTPTPLGVHKSLRIISVGQFDSSDSKKWELPGRPRVASRASAAKRKARSQSAGAEPKKVGEPGEGKKRRIRKLGGQPRASKTPKPKPNQPKKAKKAPANSKRPRAPSKVSNPLLVSMNTVGIPVVQLTNSTTGAPVSFISAPCIMSPSYTYTTL